MAEQRSTQGPAKRDVPPESTAIRPAGTTGTNGSDLAPSSSKSPDSIPWYRRCPVCWEGNGGVGNVYTTNGSTRYYRCCQSIKPGKPACGHTWTALIRTEVIKVESRTIQIDHR